ncbi:MAG: cation transporter [Bacilli bacterium]|nr:cation transporter [Bacilli bacterium]
MKTDKNILIAFLLNIFFSLFELIGGLIIGSVAIISDSLHDFGDALSIGIAYILEKKSMKKPDDKYTYGYIKYSVMGSIITTVILITGSLFVVYESVKRFFHPVAINYNGMILMAIFGVIVNTIAGYKTKDGDSINQKAVNIHMLEDVLGWIVVLIGSILMKFTDISVIDSILSICVAVFILFVSIRNMKAVFDIFLEKTPDSINIDEVKEHLLNIKGIENVHHIHIRTIDGYSNFATLHAVVKKYDYEIKDKVKKELKKFGISHSTVEIELEDEDCNDEKCHVDHGKVHHH